MSDMTASDADLRALDYPGWAAEMRRRLEDRGFFEDLGPDHHAQFAETEGGCLLVTFESFEEMQALSGSGAPLGRDLAEARGWSHLAVISRGQSWFRDARVYGFFDQLNDDGFFDDFDTILFCGAGPGGYAACAYSVAAPGARVLALAPQATLDPRVAGWEPRFVAARRHSFTDRYGYGPDMLDAADAAWVLFDPREPLDAMHAALYARPGVTLLRLPGMGGALLEDLTGMGIHGDLVAAAMEGALDAASFSGLYRARRDYAPYLRGLLARLDADARSKLAAMLCRAACARVDDPRFRRRLDQLVAADMEDEAEMPARRSAEA